MILLQFNEQEKGFKMRYTDCILKLSDQLVAKEKIAYDDQFLLLPQQCFNLIQKVYFHLTKVFNIFSRKFSKSSAADFLYVEKG